MPTVETPHSLCRFGIARCDVTPPVGIYHRMWGAATHERATGVHRPLSATAMVFEPVAGASDGNGQQVLIALDHCILWAKDMDRLLDAVATGSGTPREQIVVTFGHTHSAGLMDSERSTLPGGELIPPYLEKLGSDLAGLVRQARSTVQRATISYGLGRSMLAANRDFWDEATGQFVCGYNPQGPADDTVLVARVTAAVGPMLAVIVNYACHPTTLAWENTLISPDFPGAMREVVERASGVPCVFLQGASGDLGPREGFVGDPEVADRNGRQLGYAALAALETLPPPGTRFKYVGPVVSGATLGTWTHVMLENPGRDASARWRLRRWSVDLARRPESASADETLRRRKEWVAREASAHATGDSLAARDARAMVERLDRQLTRIAALPPGDTFAFPITLWQMGDAFWLAVEGELYHVFQRTLRARCGPRPLVVATLANGARPAYLPPAEAYGKGLYQESIAMLAPGSLERLTESIAGQLAAWQEA